VTGFVRHLARNSAYGPAPEGWKISPGTPIAPKTHANPIADDAKSVTRQVEHARAYAAQKGWAVDEAHVYADDQISGAMFGAGRPGLARLLNALRPRPPFQLTGGAVQAPGYASPYILTNFARCADCGGPIGTVTRSHGTGAKRWPARFYGCTTRDRRGPAICSNRTLLRHEVLVTLGALLVVPPELARELRSGFRVLDHLLGAQQRCPVDGVRAGEPPDRHLVGSARARARLRDLHLRGRVLLRPDLRLRHSRGP